MLIILFFVGRVAPPLVDLELIEIIYFSFVEILSASFVSCFGISDLLCSVGFEILHVSCNRGEIVGFNDRICFHNHL